MKSKKLFVLVLSMMMVLSMSAVSVFAGGSDGTATPASGAYLVKYLKLADGVTNPGITFTFHFVGAESNGVDTDIADKTIVPQTTSESAKDGKSVVGSLALSDILPNYTHAGVYTYTVTETAGVSGWDKVDDYTYKKVTPGNNGAETTETLKFSQESYKLEVRVANDGSGGTKTPEVSIIKDPTNTSADSNKPKVDPTDSDPTVTTEQKSDGTGTEDVDHGEDSTIPGFSFTNVYQKTEKKPVDPNPEDPTQGKYGAAGITKTVTGEYGDKTFEFPFTLTMTAGTGIADTTADAYLYTGKTKGDKVTVTFGQAKSFKLKDGQSLIFEELPTGVSYTVTEGLQGCGVNNETQYLASFNGTANTAGKGADLTGEITVSDNNSAGDAAENDGHFINNVDSDDVTPTGIVINNLPYVLLIGLALGGIVLFSRKKRYE